ncbi:MAG: RpiB/LacA/LacB family sugar-phosphate isomerase [Candidatus Limiplasma sp.]|nr:RpiB/LacA/LacB family sugar-phosphate isomerase [Candidatus Limiplasma sp.]
MTEGLICGTGIGMAISANKVKGAYAAVCHDVYSTERPVLSNDANIMCIGALVAGKALALSLVKQWVDLAFAQSPSGGKIKKIKEAEQREYAAPAHNCG